MKEELTVKEFCKELAKIYELLTWEWAQTRDKGKHFSYDVPTEQQLLDTFRELVTDKHLVSDGDQVGTGGLNVTRHDYSDEAEESYELSFDYSIVVRSKELQKQLGKKHGT